MATWNEIVTGTRAQSDGTAWWSLVEVDDTHLRLRWTEGTGLGTVLIDLAVDNDGDECLLLRSPIGVIPEELLPGAMLDAATILMCGLVTYMGITMTHAVLPLPDLRPTVFWSVAGTGASASIYLKDKYALPGDPIWD